MNSTVAITLGSQQQAQLDALAIARQETSANLIVEAVEEYLRFDTAFREAVTEGLVALEAGDAIDFNGFEDSFRAYIDQRMKVALD